jgi:predicted amidohydrolase YtcJ
MSLVSRAVPSRTLQQDLAAAKAAVEHVAAQGVTAVHHMGDWDDVEVFRAAYQRGLLKVRVYACTPLSQWKRLADEIAAHGHGNDWLRIGGLKGFVDGSLGSHTAAFLEPYSDEPASRGLLVNRAQDLREWTAAADKAGLHVVVHAIGDRAIRLQLDAFEQAAKENGPRDRRFRIEHAQHIHPDDIRRFADLGVIASMQPYHAIDDGRWANPLIGSMRAKTTYAFRSLLDCGARIAFGSDWFVAPPTPLEGIYAAVTRRTLDGKNPDGWVPEQKISVEEALRAYTIDAAYAGFADQNTGSLTVGKLADLVVLDHDITNIPPHQIRDARVNLTLVGGEIVFRNADL